MNLKIRLKLNFRLNFTKAMSGKFGICFPILLIIILLGGCAHIPLSNLPSSVHTVYVQMFKNETFQYGMEEKLTNAIIKELIMDKRLQVATNAEHADASLSGTITNYTRTILATD